MSGKGILERLINAADLPSEPVPGRPLVEIAEDKKVLIENHLGVSEYSQTQIGVVVKFGRIYVTGEGLTITQLTKERIVISGVIGRVELLKG